MYYILLQGWAALQELSYITPPRVHDECQVIWTTDPPKFETPNLRKANSLT